jgi:hypothetical protein
LNFTLHTEAKPEYPVDAFFWSLTVRAINSNDPESGCSAIFSIGRFTPNGIAQPITKADIRQRFEHVCLVAKSGHLT